MGRYLDRAFHKVRLPALATGETELILSCGYTNHMEMEDCFGLGDFGVSSDRVIVAEPGKLYFGDWTKQGYFHCAGSLIYHAELPRRQGETRRLWLGEVRAVDVAVHDNGTLVGHIP